MAMGGSHNCNKGGNSSSSCSNNSSSNNKARPYGLMLLLAFGAALVGVMVLHKLRERRIFNLLIQDKDNRLISLHIALQEERDYSRVVKTKHEELKAKMYSIRTQKMELDRTVREMKSTIGSLKEELRTMEAALEEKQNETKIPRRACDDHLSGNPHVMESVESLKQKEAEIDDLKHRLESKVWSVSTDDPSDAHGINETVSKSKEEGDRNGNGSKSMNVKQSDATKEAEHQIGSTEGGTNRTETLAKEVNIKGSNGAEHTTNEQSQELKGVDLSGDGEEIKGRGNGHLQNTEISELEGQKIHVNPQRGRKLETQVESFKNKEGGVRGRLDYINSIKGNKWSLVARDRRVEKKGGDRSNGAANMRGTRFFEDDQNENKGREEHAASIRKLTGDGPVREVRTTADSSDGNGNFSGVTSHDTIQKQAVGKSEDHGANTSQQNVSSKDIDKPADNADADADAHALDFPGDLDIANAEEQDNDVTEDGWLRELGSDFEEYKEEIDESEFWNGKQFTTAV